MTERLLVAGNEAVGWGAVAAGCLFFFGYPITPQNEITEWFARELPKRGGVFVQSQSETGSINMLYGAACTGVRAMTSTSSPGWSLMLETMSHLSNAELPCVVVLVQRGGPGMGTTRHAQMDYLSATRGGGHGGYKNIVLAPFSVQENSDFVQLAFHLADKYRNPVVVLTDGIIGQMAETLEVRKLDFGPLPPKDWAMVGKGFRADGKPRLTSCAKGLFPVPDYSTYKEFLAALDKKWKDLASEVRYVSYYAEDAKLVLVAYGYCARVCQEVVDMARAEGLPAGLIRPITLWPFPYEPLREKARQGVHLLAVEDSLGQLVDDVAFAAEGRVPVDLVSALDRHSDTDGGMIEPGSVLHKVKELLSVKVKAHA